MNILTHIRNKKYNIHYRNNIELYVIYLICKKYNLGFYLETNDKFKPMYQYMCGCGNKSMIYNYSRILRSKDIDENLYYLARDSTVSFIVDNEDGKINSIEIVCDICKRNICIFNDIEEIENINNDCNVVKIHNSIVIYSKEYNNYDYKSSYIKCNKKFSKTNISVKDIEKLFIEIVKHNGMLVS